MPIRDLLKKKDRVEKNDSIHHEAAAPEAPAPVPEFTFMRSDTYTQEIITPPTFHHSDAPSPTDGANESKFRHTLFKGRQRSTSSASTSSRTSSKSKERPPPSPTTRRLSHRLGLKRDDSSSNVPQDLPEITAGENEGKESQWEKRATILAHTNEKNRSTPGTPIGSPASLSHNMSSLSLGNTGGEAATHESGVVSTKLVDDNIQEAIRLHEAGELETSTQMFGRLADPNGENNALSQVLYGLALRHGWGCTPDPEKAVTFLSAAASNAAGIEELALQAGMKKGGAAKGELVLAIFELANCFRHGWGVQIDKVAAKQYYETAANLGDTDAMNEVAWCYVEGFGCKKDKYLGAKYYRLAEAGGSKTLGNTWIWKEKYNPPTTATK